ncbi:MAG: dTMP kinase [Succinivibrio sp.]
MSKGFFITLEGSEGCGKSTQINNIRQFLESRGRKVMCLREPGGTPIAEEIRALLKNPRDDDSMCDSCELLLMYAARAQLVNTVIKPALEQGIDVLCDRHDLSTIAYQGGGRGISMDHINALRNVVLGDFRPDITILIDLDVKDGMARAKSRGELDRFEQSKIDFFERVRNTYLDYAKNHPDAVCVVDGASAVDEVFSNIKKVILDKLDV